ncbi:amidohydrolase family protein [Streptomyces sp. NPDC050433]|uniref:metal-dependent hydrolase family protein n=1 Tax=unclassified Streptomyces TaxID=2593676 RepID=UPI0034477A7C
MVSPLPLLFRQASVLDATAAELVENRNVLVRDGRITEVGGPEVGASDAHVIDLRGKVLMPGLIDAHVHTTLYTADLAAVGHHSATYMAARAGHLLRAMLDRGFTTVRDAGGADYGLAQAVEEGWFTGPRVLYGGKAITQSGGHGDHRHRGQIHHDDHYCNPGHVRIADGETEMRKAVRDEIRRGASHVKLMLGGGIVSPTSRIDSTHFGEDELRAAVEEAAAANRYVLGHAYTARAVNRALELGVRSIEHGNLLDDRSIELFLERDAFYVPTLVTYEALAAEGVRSGLRPEHHRKIAEVLDAGLGALEKAHRAGITIAFGSDLLGDMQRRQLEEFRLRAQVQPAAHILRSATTDAARLLRLEGRIGVVAPGAYADLLVVRANPLDDITVLTDPDKQLAAIVQGGRLHLNTLD